MKNKKDENPKDSVAESPHTISSPGLDNMEDRDYVEDEIVSIDNDEKIIPVTGFSGTEITLVKSMDDGHDLRIAEFNTIIVFTNKKGLKVQVSIPSDCAQNRERELKDPVQEILEGHINALKNIKDEMIAKAYEELDKMNKQCDEVKSGIEKATVEQKTD